MQMKMRPKRATTYESEAVHLIKKLFDLQVKKKAGSAEYVELMTQAIQKAGSKATFERLSTEVHRWCSEQREKG